MSTSQDTKTNTSSTIIEMVTFKLNPTIDGSSFLSKGAVVCDWMKKQPGFLYRSLVQDTDNERWIDIVYWDSLPNAKRAQESFMTNTENQSWVSMIDPSSVKMQHHGVVSEVMAESCQ